jgi:hypothetical protein
MNLPAVRRNPSRFLANCKPRIEPVRGEHTAIRGERKPLKTAAVSAARSKQPNSCIECSNKISPVPRQAANQKLK